MSDTRHFAAALGLCLLLISSTPASAAPVEWTVASGGNGHSYDLIIANLNWVQAKAAAAALGGYLVTITSAAENQFVLATFDARLNAFAWIGASDNEMQGAAEGNWEWVVGPEAGLQFWQNGPPASGGTVTPGNFANWGPVEPNNFNDEDAAAFNLGGLSGGGTNNGQWGDTDLTTVLGAYLVEFNTGTSGPVPEPSALGLLAVGTFLLALRRRR